MFDGHRASVTVCRCRWLVHINHIILVLLTTSLPPPSNNQNIHTHYLNSGSFDILDTNYSPAPVRVALYNTKEELIWDSEPFTIDGSFSQRGSGKHWLCLENGLTYEQKEDNKRLSPQQRVTRTIGFSLRIKKSMSGVPEVPKDGSKNDIDGTTTRLLELTDNLNENFQVLVDHMSFMKKREVVHRQLHEETFTKVVRWNILEICTVVLVTFGQVLNVWWILSNKRSY
jgi:hypothetical protein|eukprot:scaffold2215_cov191-Alexandrium_tamarense.AAC.19